MPFASSCGLGSCDSGPAPPVRYGKLLASCMSSNSCWESWYFLIIFTLPLNHSFPRLTNHSALQLRKSKQLSNVPLQEPRPHFALKLRILYGPFISSDNWPRLNYFGQIHFYLNRCSQDSNVYLVLAPPLPHLKYPKFHLKPQVGQSLKPINHV